MCRSAFKADREEGKAIPNFQSLPHPFAWLRRGSAISFSVGALLGLELEAGEDSEREEKSSLFPSLRIKIALICWFR